MYTQPPPTCLDTTKKSSAIRRPLADQQQLEENCARQLLGIPFPPSPHPPLPPSVLPLKMKLGLLTLSLCNLLSLCLLRTSKLRSKTKGLGTMQRSKDGPKGFLSSFNPNYGVFYVSDILGNTSKQLLCCPQELWP